MSNPIQDIEISGYTSTFYASSCDFEGPCADQCVNPDHYGQLLFSELNDPTMVLADADKIVTKSNKITLVYPFSPRKRNKIIVKSPSENGFTLLDIIGKISLTCKDFLGNIVYEDWLDCITEEQPNIFYVYHSS